MKHSDICVSVSSPGAIPKISLTVSLQCISVKLFGRASKADLERAVAVATGNARVESVVYSRLRGRLKVTFEDIVDAIRLVSLKTIEVQGLSYSCNFC